MFGMLAGKAVGKGSGFVANWGKVFKYGKGGEMSAIEHIMYRHGPDTGFSGVSKFAKGTTARMIKRYSDEALQFGKPILQNDGSYMLRYNLGRTIGTGSNGVPTSEIMMYIRDGWIRTAFPIH
jgi:filamentous hemagglutinin